MQLKQEKEKLRASLTSKNEAVDTILKCEEAINVLKTDNIKLKEEIKIKEFICLNNSLNVEKLIYSRTSII